MPSRNNVVVGAVALLLLLIIATMFNFFRNSDSNYQKVTLNDILQSPDKFNGKKVEYTGVFEAMFETSNLDGKIWLNTSPDTVYVPSDADMPGLSSGYSHAKVRVLGTLQAEKDAGYGHMGFSHYQITADRIELIEKLDSK